MDEFACALDDMGLSPGKANAASEDYDKQVVFAQIASSADYIRRATQKTMDLIY